MATDNYTSELITIDGRRYRLASYDDVGNPPNRIVVVFTINGRRVSPAVQAEILRKHKELKKKAN